MVDPRRLLELQRGGFVLNQGRVVVFTDGSVLGNGNPCVENRGGIGIYWGNGRWASKLKGSERLPGEQTVNRAEMYVSHLHLLSETDVALWPPSPAHLSRQSFGQSNSILILKSDSKSGQIQCMWSTVSRGPVLTRDPLRRVAHLTPGCRSLPPTLVRIDTQASVSIPNGELANGGRRNEGQRSYPTSTL